MLFHLNILSKQARRSGLAKLAQSGRSASWEQSRRRSGFNGAAARTKLLYARIEKSQVFGINFYKSIYLQLKQRAYSMILGLKVHADRRFFREILPVWAGFLRIMQAGQHGLAEKISRKQMLSGYALCMGEMPPLQFIIRDRR